MAFIQQHRPQSSRQLSYHAPEPAEVATSAHQLKRSLEQSEEWVLFSPIAPSTAARTHTTSTERTPRTAGLSRFSEFGSLDTAAQSDQDDDAGTFLGTEEELDSLDDGLHAFHEPSEHGAPPNRLQQSADTVLPTHDGLGEFQPDVAMHEHMWQFERPRRRAARRRSSVQRHFSILDDTDDVTTEQERRQRIEKWRLEQSRALLEEIEKETRRRRRMSMVSAVRSRTDSTQQEDTSSTTSQIAPSASDAESESSEESTESLSFWQRITRRVIRDLIGLDEDTLSVIFGEALPEEAMTPKPGSPTERSAEKTLQDAGIDVSALSEESWQTRLLERVAQELGILVNQLSEHPGAFSTYQRTQSAPDYVGLMSKSSNTTLATDLTSSHATSSQPSAPSPASAQFAPTFPTTSHAYSEASLWGIEEEPSEVNPSNSFHVPPPAPANITEDLAREREYWERELDVTMIFNFLMKRFSSRRSSISSQQPRKDSSIPSAIGTEEGVNSARRAAIIRQNHPLVSRTTGRGLPTSSDMHSRETKRKDVRKDTTYRTYFTPQNALRHQKLRSSSSCASQSTKKSKRSSGSGRNYWDLGGSVGSGSVFAGEA